MMKWCTAAALLLALMQTQESQANNVSAKISGGSLYIYGDSANNHLTIKSTSAGSVTVTGTTTTVNGASGPVVLNGWNNGIFVYLAGGNDSVWLQAGDVIGATHFDLGSGDDRALLGSSDSLPEELLLDPLFELIFPGADELATSMLRLRQSLTVLGFAGADSVTVTNCTVAGFATFDTAGGADEIYFGSDAGEILTYFQNSVVIVPGSESDTVSIGEVQINRDLTIDDPTHASNVDVFNSRVGGNLQIFTSLTADNVTLEDLVVTGFVKSILKDGSDTFNCTNVRGKQMEVFLGIGDDKALLTNVQLERLWGYLEDGSDNFKLDQIRVTTSYYFGAGGNDFFTIQNTTGSNAYVYGDGGTDTLKRSGNSIGKFYVYSVEKNL